MYDRGLEIRSAVLGQEYVNKALTAADDFTKPLQDLVTEYCWGAVRAREGLALKTHELRTHMTNGVTRDEIREIFLQVAIYAGVPAAVDSFRIAREALTELDQR
jgi:4-carboxymuconolactone decarboxylase